MVQFQSQLSRPSLANQNTVLPGASQRGEINGWNFECLAETNKVFSLHDFLGLKVPTTPITAMGCRQCLPLSVVQLKGKQIADNPIAVMGFWPASWRSLKIREQ